MRGGSSRAAGIPAQGGPDAAEGRRAARDPALLRRVGALFRPHTSRLVVIGLSIVVASGLGVITPFLTQKVFDDALFVTGGPNLRLLTFLVALQIVIPLVSSLIGVLQTYLTTLLGNRVMADLRNRLFEHLQSMDLGFFTSTKTGVIQSRLQNDVAGVQNVLTETASSILSNFVTVTASLIAMLLLSWQLTLVSLCAVAAVRRSADPGGAGPAPAGGTHAGVPVGHDARSPRRPSRSAASCSRRSSTGRTRRSRGTRPRTTARSTCRSARR